MRQTNHSELNNFIKKVYDSKLSLLVWGKIGIGKSVLMKETAKEIAKSKNKEFLEWNKISDDKKRSLMNSENAKGKFIFADLRSSQMDIGDVKGLPSFFDGVTEWKANILFKVLSQKESDGILFFDELLQAPPTILSNLYQIILDRQVGEISLSENIGIFAGTNTITDNAGVFNIPSPLANRFLHVELSIPSKKDWVNWSFKNDIDNRIIAFIEFNEKYLHTYDKVKNNLVFSSPRSWEFLSRLIKDNKNIDEIEISAQSTIGEGVGIEFLSFIKLQKKLNIEDLLKHPEKVKNIVELSEKYALLSAVSDRIKEKPEDLPTYQAVMKLLNYLEEEFKIILMRFILTNAQEGLIKIKKAKTKEEARNYLIKNIFGKIPEWTKNIQRFTEFLTF